MLGTESQKEGAVMVCRIGCLVKLRERVLESTNKTKRDANNI